MKDRFAPPLVFATVAAAIVSASAMIGNKAYAEGPIIDSTPFVSKRTLSEVRAEVKSGRSSLASSEWDLQANGIRNVASSYPRAEARSAYLAARDESNALTSEDSGASYFAKRSLKMSRSSNMAGAMR